MQVPLISLFSRFSNSQFPNATSLVSPVNVSVENIFCQKFFYVNVFCCMFDQSFKHPFDKKYRSLTAPLVQKKILFDNALINQLCV